MRVHQGLVIAGGIAAVVACTQFTTPTRESSSAKYNEDGTATVQATPVPLPNGASPVPRGPSPVPRGPSPVPRGPSPVPRGPTTPGGSPLPSPGASPSPGTSPSPGASPSPSPPSGPLLTVTNLVVATGTPYQIIQNSSSCCSNTMGKAWLDWPYVLQRNFGAGPTNPLFMIRTAISDTNATANPHITFTVNRCARVQVIFGEKTGLGIAPPYPSWIAAQGFTCSITPGGGGQTETFFHETLGSADQVSGPSCGRSFSAGAVQLGPREPTGVESKLYTVFIQAADISTCP